MVRLEIAIGTQILRVCTQNLSDRQRQIGPARADRSPGFTQPRCPRLRRVHGTRDNPLRPRTFETLRDDLLATAFDRATADQIILGPILIVAHPRRVSNTGCLHWLGCILLDCGSRRHVEGLNLHTLNASTDPSLEIPHSEFMLIKYLEESIVLLANSIPNETCKILYFGLTLYSSLDSCDQCQNHLILRHFLHLHIC